MPERILVFLESSTSGHLFIRAARKLGYRPVLVTESGSRYRNLADERIEVVLSDTSDLESIASSIDELQKTARVAGILSTSGAYAATAASLSHRYGLPGGNPLAIGSCQNKFMQRETLRSAGLVCPQYRLVESASNGAVQAKDMGFPLIVKPVVGSGSTGVRLCFTQDQVQNHVDELLQQGCPDGVLIEEFVEGPEFSVETIGNHVLGITKKHLGDLPYFVEIGHDFPAILPQQVAAAIEDTVRTALAALRLAWGPAHTELRLTKRGPTIIEVNPRMGGDMIPELVRLSTGIDVVSQTIRLVTGHALDLSVQTRRHASIRFLTPSKGGTVRWQADLDSAIAIPDVSEVQLYNKEGSQVLWRGDYRDRIGHVIAVGNTLHHVEIDLAAALAHLRYRIDPVSD